LTAVVLVGAEANSTTGIRQNPHANPTIASDRLISFAGLRVDPAGQGTSIEKP
jgi:hypothetical protein